LIRFVITGYPRSGHGWLANYLYKAGTVVAHEGALSFLYEDRTIRQAHVAALRSLDGDCSSSWLLYPDLLRMVPRVVVIERPLNEVVPSYRRAVGNVPFAERRMFNALSQGFKDAMLLHPLVLPYESPYSLSTIERICNYIGEDFDLVRFALLRHTRVLQDTGSALESMEK
tara:strand:- start:77 stop:589 length:513 start_codon:yes stop_codon:yes gene_type:complete